LHLVGQLLTLIHDAWTREHKICTKLHAITSQKTAVFMSHHMYIFIKIWNCNWL